MLERNGSLRRAWAYPHTKWVQPFAHRIERGQYRIVAYCTVDNRFGCPADRKYRRIEYEYEDGTLIMGGRDIGDGFFGVAPGSVYPSPTENLILHAERLKKEYSIRGLKSTDNKYRSVVMGGPVDNLLILQNKGGPHQSLVLIPLHCLSHRMLAGRGIVQPSAAQLTLAVDISDLGLDPAGLVGNYAGDSVEFKLIGTCHFFYTPSSGQVRLKCRVDSGKTHAGGDLIGVNSGHVPGFLMQVALASCRKGVSLSVHAGQQGHVEVSASVVTPEPETDLGMAPADGVLAPNEKKCTLIDNSTNPSPRCELMFEMSSSTPSPF